jgi:hypothetical protein
MKRDRVFLMLACFSVCTVWSQQVNAVPQLGLSMTGSFNSATSTITAQVNRTNTDFGLGGLSYTLSFSESLNLTREYSDYGWITNDGLFDNSNPVDGSSSASFLNIGFDTIHSPAGSEFSAGSGIVESLTIHISNLTPRWIYFDIISPSASNGAGSDLISNLGGSINIGQGHELAIQIPEPVSLALFGLGGLVALRRQKK